MSSLLERKDPGTRSSWRELPYPRHQGSLPPHTKTKGKGVRDACSHGGQMQAHPYTLPHLLLTFSPTPPLPSVSPVVPTRSLRSLTASLRSPPRSLARYFLPPPTLSSRRSHKDTHTLALHTRSPPRAHTPHILPHTRSRSLTHPRAPRCRPRSPPPGRPSFRGRVSGLH